jgi:hypothetical protein
MAEVVAHALKAQDRDRVLNRAVRDRLSAQALLPYNGKTVQAQIVGISPHGLDLFVPGAETEIFLPARRFAGPLKLADQGLSVITPEGKKLGAGDDLEVVIRSVDPKKGQIDAVPRKEPVAGSKAAALTDAGLKPLSLVRGDGFTSPLVGQMVTTQGVVTALNGVGFYIQPEGGASIGDRGGLLVRSRDAGVAIGDRVTVRGVVRESRKEEALYDRSVVELVNRPVVKVVSSGNALPPPVVLGAGGLGTPPSDPAAATEFWRKLLGQRVQIKAATAISPSNLFNDLVVLPDGWVPPGQRSTQGGVLQKDGQENLVKASIKGRDHVGGLPITSVGDRVENIEGIVTYRSGDFQIELSKPAKVSATPKAEAEACTLVGTDNQLTISSVNALNLHPGEQARGKRLAERIVHDLNSPDIVALQEIQDNDGPVVSNEVDASKTYEMLIEKIKAAGGPEYSWADLPPEPGADGGQPGGNIRNGYLYRADRVSLVEMKKVGQGDEAFSSTRKSLLARFEFSGHQVLLVNNHLTSRRGSKPWNGAGEPLVGGAEKRLLQAQAIAAAVAAEKQSHPKCDVLVVGDFNDFPQSATLEAAAGPGMTNLSMLVPEDDRFDYNYRGTLQTLCSVVGSADLAEQGRVELEYVHHNSLNPVDDSDHDHVVARVTCPQTA